MGDSRKTTIYCVVRLPQSMTQDSAPCAVGIIYFCEKFRSGHCYTWSKTRQHHDGFSPSVAVPRGTGPEIYPSNDGENPSFGRVFPSGTGLFPSQTNLESLWVYIFQSVAILQCVSTFLDEKCIRCMVLVPS